METENAVMNNGTAPTGGGGAPTIAVATTTTTPAPRLKDHTLESLKLEHQLVKVIVSIRLHKGLVDVSKDVVLFVVEFCMVSFRNSFVACFNSWLGTLMVF